jgi:hypothetical protein
MKRILTILLLMTTMAHADPIGLNRVEVLLPEKFDRAKHYRVLYVLPVEAGKNHRFGDGLKVIRELDAHNRYDLIVVAPTFDVDPWYSGKQEEYLVQTLVPKIDREYPTTSNAEGRLLLGFSKSGWGAFTLILRHPDVFGYAASWDAPLMFTEKQFGIWKTDKNFGTAENMTRYLPSALLREHAGEFQKKTRLVLAGKNLFGTFTDKRFPYDGPSHTEAAHELMDQLGVKHRYEPNLKANHSWNAKWVKPLLEMLLSISTTEANAR